MHRSHSTPRPSAAARAPRAARAQDAAFVVFVRAALLAASALLLFLGVAARAGAATTHAQPLDSVAAAGDASRTPNPRLTPDEVVAIVLDALSRNDTPVKDHGISVTFTFTSPANRAFVGPIESFADLVRDNTYRPLLYHRHAARGVAHMNGDRATVRVVVTTTGGERVAYVFALSLQNDGAYKGCWMTDGVTREPPSPLSGMRFTD